MFLLLDTTTWVFMCVWGAIGKEINKSRSTRLPFFPFFRPFPSYYTFMPPSSWRALLGGSRVGGLLVLWLILHIFRADSRIIGHIFSFQGWIINVRVWNDDLFPDFLSFFIRFIRFLQDLSRRQRASIEKKLEIVNTIREGNPPKLTDCTTISERELGLRLRIRAKN